MTSVTPVESTTQTTSTQSSSTTAAASATITSSTTIASLKDLKERSPKIYNAMLEGIGMNICNEMKAHQDRLKQMMREAERES